MTKKEFLSHDWKDGDTIYKVGYKYYDYYEIPVKVMKMKVSRLAEKSFYANYCKTDSAITGSNGFFFSPSPRFLCTDIFFTKEEAKKHFEKRYNDFKERWSDRLYKHLVKKLDELDREKKSILGMFHMKIFY